MATPPIGLESSVLALRIFLAFGARRAVPIVGCLSYAAALGINSCLKRRPLIALQVSLWFSMSFVTQFGGLNRVHCSERLAWRF